MMGERTKGEDRTCNRLASGGLSGILDERVARSAMSLENSYSEPGDIQFLGEPWKFRMS